MTRSTQSFSYYPGVTKTATMLFLKFIQAQKRICPTERVGMGSGGEIKVVLQFHSASPAHSLQGDLATSKFQSVLFSGHHRRYSKKE